MFSIKILGVLFLLAFFVILPRSNGVQAQTATDPQYLFMHKASNPYGCCIWSTNDPSSITIAGAEDIVNQLGTYGSTNRKVGVSFTFDYNQYDIEVVKQSLQNFLNIAYTADGNNTNDSNVPVLIHLDGFEWWDAHPELWNWWDPATSGYDPTNINNVEWTSWNSNSAIKISWRNWGSQLRVKPHPNISSPDFVNLSLANLEQTVPIIVSWYQSLPDDKKYLFGGVIVGWEVNIGVNYWYYPNGNSYFDLSASSDPTSGVGAGVQLGYAAVSTANIKTNGILTTADLDAAVVKYLTSLTNKVYDLGVPKEKIYTHIGPDDGTISHPGVLWTSAASALTPYSQPGASFYTRATDPNTLPGWGNILNSISDTRWAAAEWNDWLHATTADWLTALRATFNYKNNRLIVYFNWFSPSQYQIDAFKTILAEVPSTPTPIPVATATPVPAPSATSVPTSNVSSTSTPTPLVVATSIPNTVRQKDSVNTQNHIDTSGNLNYPRKINNVELTFFLTAKQKISNSPQKIAGLINTFSSSVQNEISNIVKLWQSIVYFITSK